VKFGFREIQFQGSTTIAALFAVNKREVFLAEGFHQIIDVIRGGVLEPRAEVIVLAFIRFTEKFNALKILCVDGDL
jgi:hypothetical protein